MVHAVIRALETVRLLERRDDEEILVVARLLRFAELAEMEVETIDEEETLVTRRSVRLRVLVDIFVATSVEERRLDVDTEENVPKGEIILPKEPEPVTKRFAVVALPELLKDVLTMLMREAEETSRDGIVAEDVKRMLAADAKENSRLVVLILTKLP